MIWGRYKLYKMINISNHYLSIYRLMNLLMMSVLLIGCIDRNERASFIITEVTPSALDPGMEIVVQGRGFQSLQGSLAISGRPLTVLAWTDQLIRAALPLDVPTGERYLVVSRNGRHSPPFAIYINGEGGARLAAQPDLGMQSVDQAIDQSVDQMVDQMLGQRLSVALNDPNAAVIIEAERRAADDGDELWLSLVARDPSTVSGEVSWAEQALWGAAAHLTYPLDRLEFMMMTATPGPQVAALQGDLPGRIYLYHGRLNIPDSATRYTLLTLRFKIIDVANREPINISIPARFASLRGTNNQRLKGTWSGGTVQYGDQSP